MTYLLAQQAPAVAATTPEVAWSTFAPELLVAAAALAMLVYTFAGRLRMVSSVGFGVIGVATGIALIVTQDTLLGGIVTAVGAGAITIGVGLDQRPAMVQTWTASLAAFGGLLLTAWQWHALMATPEGPIAPQVTMQGSVALDGIAFFTRLTVYSTIVLILPMGYGYLRDRGIYRPDFEPLVLLSGVGMALLGAATDLITLFIALEVLSLALYVLSGFARKDRRSQESGLKYFVLGAVASAILLYGMALLYIASGSLELGVIGTSLALVTTPPLVAMFGLALVLVGLGFKVALVPFHLWIPDVYQGAPTNVTAFMAAATKAAGFAAVLRLFLVAFGRLEEFWVPVLAVIAAVTMLYGAIVALVQRDIKRILAYSSVAHAGYAAIGIAAGSRSGLAGTLWYLLTYAVTVIGAHGCVIAIERRRGGEVTLVDLRGLGRTSPALAGILTLCLLSLAGIPPTAGFAGKLAVFQAGVAADLEWLVVVGVVSSVIAAFFYLRIMGMMYLEDAPEDAPEPRLSTGLSAGLAAAAAAVVVLGVLPDAFLTLADHAAVLAR